MLKFARKWKALHEILLKIMDSLSAIGVATLLLGMFMYIFSLFGMELFGKRANKDIEGLIIPQEELAETYHRGEVVTPIRLSFDNIYLSMNTIFVICMADGWNWVMYENVLPFGDKWWMYSIFFCIMFILGNKI